MGKTISVQCLERDLSYDKKKIRTAPLPAGTPFAVRFYREFLSYRRLNGATFLRRQKCQLGKLMFAATEDLFLSARGRCAGAEPTFKRSEIYSVDFCCGKVGAIMTDAAELLQSVNEEVDKSRKILENLTNKVTKISDEVNPKLLAQAKRLRESRMTAVAEVEKSLKALREVRQFFIGSNYAEEIGRLKEFVSLCKELKVLIDDGTLDAVSTVAIRMALKEEVSP